MPSGQDWHEVRGRDEDTKPCAGKSSVSVLFIANYSHSQALGQCGRFIEEHLSNASLVKTSSTVAAVEAVLSDESGTSAAIASKLSVRLFDGLELLYEGIQDENCKLLFLFSFWSFSLTGEP